MTRLWLTGILAVLAPWFSACGGGAGKEEGPSPEGTQAPLLEARARRP
jgi:hypothetical protein